MFANLKLFTPYIKHHYKRYLLGAGTLLLVDILDVTPPLIIKYAIDHLGVSDAGRHLMYAALGYILVVASQGFFRYWYRFLLYGTSFSIARRIRDKLFQHLQKLSLNFFYHTRTGDIMSRAANDVESVRTFFGDGLLTILDIAFYFMLVPVIMFNLSPTLTLYTIICSLSLPFFVYRMISRIHKKSTEIQEALSSVSGCAEENFSGVRVIKAFAQEENQNNRFRDTSQIYLQKNLSLAKLLSVFHPLLSVTVGLTIFMIILIGGFQVINGSITTGTLAAFLYLLGKVVWPMIAVGTALSLFQRASASMIRINEILEIQPEITDRLPSEVSRLDNRHSGAEIEFKNVTLSYPPDGAAPKGEPSSRDVLKSLNLRIPSNSTVLITGPIGSGKTTLLHSICRFYDCDSGEVLINGINIKDYPLKTLRSLIGFVPQDVFLFSGTIRENVGFALPQQVAETFRSPDLKSVSQSVRMDEFIESLPEKYETVLGERGINLSGGQRQRLTLARALIIKPSILMFDDCFSSVDYETEQEILKNIIANKERHQTILIVSHRLAAVSIADFVVFMDDGVIIEQGTHQELISKNNAYARFYEHQSIKEDLEKI